jgi:hypothetical protein
VTSIPDPQTWNPLELTNSDLRSAAPLLLVSSPPLAACGLPVAATQVNLHHPVHPPRRRSNRLRCFARPLLNPPRHSSSESSFSCRNPTCEMVTRSIFPTVVTTRRPPLPADPCSWVSTSNLQNPDPAPTPPPTNRCIRYRLCLARYLLLRRRTALFLVGIITETFVLAGCCPQLLVAQRLAARPDKKGVRFVGRSQVLNCLLLVSDAKS